MKRTSLLKPETLVILGAYGLLGAVFAVLFAVARAAGDWELNFQSSDMRLLAAATAIAAVCSIVLLIVGYRASAADRKLGFKLPLLMSIVVGVLAVALAEVGVRILSKPHELGWQVGQTVLLPYDWAEVARRNFEMAVEQRSPNAYLIEDPELGWTVGQSRSSADGLYHSSIEGLRSDERGRDYGADAPANSVALLGDSFAFAEEVMFQDSLGAHLERWLGLRVLNFGVGGHGVDQAALRFEQDVIAWSPRVAILAFIEDDLYRVVNTYVFLKTDWGIPLSKPRFSLTDGGLQLSNSPTLPPERMFSTPSVFDLPSIEHDVEFFAHAWKEHPLHASRLLRYLIARFPIWPSLGGADDEIVTVSTEVLRDFVATARAANIAPVVAYLATSGDLRGLERAVKKRVLAQLAAADVEVHDLTSCLRDAGTEDELFMPRGHYTGKANAAVSRCLATIVSDVMNAEAREE